MPDISHPGHMSDIEGRLAAAKLKVENDFMRSELERANITLRSIFDSIARGEQIDLRYDDGTVVTITRARPRKGGEAEG